MKEKYLVISETYLKDVFSKAGISGSELETFLITQCQPIEPILEDAYHSGWEDGYAHGCGVCEGAAFINEGTLDDYLNNFTLPAKK